MKASWGSGGSSGCSPPRTPRTASRRACSARTTWTQGGSISSAPRTRARVRMQPGTAFRSSWSPRWGTAQLFFTARTLRIVENFTGFLLDNQEAGQSLHPQRGDGVEKTYNALTVGSRGSYRLRLRVLERENAVEAVYYARYHHTRPVVQRLRFGTQDPYL